ncbi:hypothetical protein HUN08_14750 [Gordonia sp. X0973]|uniref:hypothetical protein n=1 Tax=Gordonia sp. X0973 TaxID=2742602 RepID=UPI000F532FC0|nr:hypothetical protein [Gordonia sp. X0973]QKT08319.1 hypothetical protein HUN08_14750 [Gordonia sp. X0973]
MKAVNSGGKDREVEPKVTRRGIKMRGAIAGVAAVSALTLGGGLIAPPQQAHAAGLDDVTNWLNGKGGLDGDPYHQVLDAIVNKAGAKLASEWRTELCASGATATNGQGGTADCSQSTGTGIAVVLPSHIEGVPDTVWNNTIDKINNDNTLFGWLGVNKLIRQIITDLGGSTAQPPIAQGTAKVIGDGFQFALASTGGKATAISYLPFSVATAGASGGRTSFAIAVIGMANAWNTDSVPIKIVGIDTGLAIPGVKRLDCLGAVTAAYAEGVGGCANILGTLDGRVLTGGKIPEVQAAVTNPFALLEILSDPSSVLTKLVTGILNGSSLQDLLTADIGRLTIGGDRNGAKILGQQLPNLVAFTSDYGLINPITVSWLGQNLTIFPRTGEINHKSTPNYLALPQLSGTFDPSQLMPGVTGLSLDNLNFGLFNLFANGNSNPLGGLLGTNNATALAAPSSANLDSNSALRAATTETLTNNVQAATTPSGTESRSVPEGTAALPRLKNLPSVSAPGIQHSAPSASDTAGTQHSFVPSRPSFLDGHTQSNTPANPAPNLAPAPAPSLGTPPNLGGSLNSGPAQPAPAPAPAAPASPFTGPAGGGSAPTTGGSPAVSSPTGGSPSAGAPTTGQ